MDIISAKIRKIASIDSVKTVLLLGGHDGTGFAKVLFDVAMRRFNPLLGEQDFNVYIIEHSRTYYEQLRRTIRQNRSVKLYNLFPVESTFDAAALQSKYSANPIYSKYLPLPIALRMRIDETAISNSITNDGINEIRDAEEIATFDLVICDGAWFTGDASWDSLIGAKYVLLPDINTIKNGDVFDEINENAEYTRQPILATTEQDDAYDNGLGVALFRLND